MDDREDWRKDIRLELGLEWTARNIVENEERILEPKLTKAVKRAHKNLITAAYPLDIVLSILNAEADSYSEWEFSGSMDNWLKGSAKTGLITIETLTEYMELFFPVNVEFYDWYDAAVTPIISSLERLLETGTLTPMVYKRTKTLRIRLPLEITAVIREYIDTLPEDR